MTVPQVLEGKEKPFHNIHSPGRSSHTIGRVTDPMLHLYSDIGPEVCAK